MGTDDEFLAFAKDADIFFFSSNTWSKWYAEKKVMLDQLKSVKNKKVYDHEGSGKHTWHEQRKAEYDIVLEDMCKIAGMTTDKTKHKRHFWRNVFTEPVGKTKLLTCNPNGLKSRATECKLVCDLDNCIKGCKPKKKKKKKSTPKSKRNLQPKFRS